MTDPQPLLTHTANQRRLRALLLVLAGALQTLGFAPWSLWPAGIVSLIAILVLCVRRPSRALFADGWLMGLGLFGSGASWVYVSIHEYGMTAAPLAALMTFGFVAGLALVPALVFWCWGNLSETSHWRRLWLFPAVWVLGDWFRGWFLTGFPWLLLGTSQVDGPLAGWAPVLGVHGVTFFLAMTASLAVATLLHWLGSRRGPAALTATAMLLPWLIGPLLHQIDWTERYDQRQSVAAIQGNISQHVKWDPDYLQRQIDIYRDLTEPHWDKDIVLWPETALPATQDQASRVLDALETRANETDTAFITGLPWYGESEDYPERVFHNSLMGFGTAQGTYHKQRLVPFGEYVPLESLLRGTMEFLDMPMSVFRPGPSDQEPMVINGRWVHPFICYEIAYPDFVARYSHDTGYLLTVSNDAWFGRSIGPLQHQQIARMRALETRRYVLRGTNNGLTTVVNERGEVMDQAEHYERDVLVSELYPVRGQTPFMATGSWLIVTLAAILIVFGRQPRRDQPQEAQTA